LNNINIINIVKYYNAVERLIILAIRDVYYRNLPVNKSLHKNIDNEITSLGFKYKTNNKHILKFLSRSVDCKDFLNQKINIDQKISWSSFFNLFSMLRNNIAHNGGYIGADIRNKFNGICKNIISEYFIIESDKLMAKDNIQFLNFFERCDWFVVNLVKFIYQEENLKFLGMN